jgi:PadR family transcriptional regulator PadR
MALTSQTQAVLAAFLRDPTEPRYGLDLAREALLATGTIYPVLARLERIGWVTSEWETVDASEAGRPRRRYYRLTAEGLSATYSEFTATAQLLGQAGISLSPRERIRIA